MSENFVKPFQRKGRPQWYLQLGKEQIPLGRCSELEAIEKSVAIQKERAARGAEPKKAVTSHDVREVFALFLEWCEKHREKLTYDWYRKRLRAFSRTLPKELTVSGLKPFMVQQWVDAHPQWSGSQRRGCIVSVERALRWAEKLGHIDKSPVKGMEKPEIGRRDKVLDDAEFRTLLGNYAEGDPFREVLEYVYLTGCRPQEVVRLEARHAQLEQGRMVLPPAEAKGKKRHRVIYMTARAQEIVAALMERHPDGALFRNAKGRAWTAWSINNRFCRLQASAAQKLIKEKGLDPTDEEVRALAATLPRTTKAKGKVVERGEKELMRDARKRLRNKLARKYGSKFCLYNLRHSAANRLLVSGVDNLTVSTLLGHQPGSQVLAQHYAHLDKRGDYLRGELGKGETKGEGE